MSPFEEMYMGRVKNVPCVICADPRVDVHHLMTGLGGGRMHLLTAPLCLKHHPRPGGKDVNYTDAQEIALLLETFREIEKRWPGHVAQVKALLLADRAIQRRILTHAGRGLKTILERTS